MTKTRILIIINIILVLLILYMLNTTLYFECADSIGYQKFIWYLLGID